MNPARRDYPDELSGPGDASPPVGAQSVAGPRQPASHSDSSARGNSVAQVASVLLCVVAITLYVQLGARRKAKPAPSVVTGAGLTVKADPPKAVSEPARLPEPKPAPADPPAAPAIDEAAVAQAQAELDAASRDRAGPTSEPRRRPAA